MKTITPTTINVGPVRFSYLNVFKPRKVDKGNNGDLIEQYDVCLLIPKTPTKFCPDPLAIANLLAATQKEAIAVKWGDKPPKVLTNAVKDGDKVLNKNTGEPMNPDHWFLNVSAKVEYPPVLINGARLPAYQDQGWKSGDWGIVQLSFFAYDTNGNKGVSAGLRAIQFLYSDEALGVSNDPASVAATFDVVKDAQINSVPTGASAANMADPFANS